MQRCTYICRGYKMHMIESEPSEDVHIYIYIYIYIKMFISTHISLEHISAKHNKR